MKKLNWKWWFYSCYLGNFSVLKSKKFSLGGTLFLRNSTAQLCSASPLPLHAVHSILSSKYRAVVETFSPTIQKNFLRLFIINPSLRVHSFKALLGGSNKILNLQHHCLKRYYKVYTLGIWLKIFFTNFKKGILPCDELLCIK